MDRPPVTPEELAADTVRRMIIEGLKKHGEETWRDEPITMHLGKAARHAQTASLLIDHPDYTQDAESALDHAERAVCRAVMALWVIKQREP